MAKPVAQSDAPTVHLNGKVNGIILNLICEPLADAQIAFTNKEGTRLITSEQDGHFIVDLPAADYLVAVSTPKLGEVKSSALTTLLAKGSELHLFVNTGVESTCPCFEPDIEDLLIPVKPLIINTQMPERKVLYKPKLYGTRATSNKLMNRTRNELTFYH